MTAMSCPWHKTVQITELQNSMSNMSLMYINSNVQSFEHEYEWLQCKIISEAEDIVKVYLCQLLASSVCNLYAVNPTTNNPLCIIKYK